MINESKNPLNIMKKKRTNHLNIAVLSNICLEPYLGLEITKCFGEDGISINVNSINFNEFGSMQSIKRFKSYDLIVVFLNFEYTYPNCSLQQFIQKKNCREKIIECEVEKAITICSTIKTLTTAKIMWFGYEDYYSNISNVLGNVQLLSGIVDKINLKIIGSLESDILFIDTKHLIANIGIYKAYNNNNKYRWNSPYSRLMIELICKEVHKQYLINMGITKKCLILDCDNVLWGGILSEDGIEEISISNSGSGRPFQDFQRYLLELYYHGVILAVCSKNDEPDVISVFNKHTGMLLKEEHIACFKCNWNNKPDNIESVANCLNIGLDSIVFVDDSEFEIQAVRQQLPEVVSIKYERDKIYEQLSCFNLTNKKDKQEINQRNLTYKTDVLRRSLRETSKSFADYVKSLNQKIEIHVAQKSEYARISELSQRTNKYTNGTRYSVDELLELERSKDFKLYAVYVSDKFSNLGLVGAIAVKSNTLKLFTLSCRVLSRSIEDNMLQFLKENHNVDRYVFKSTNKNEGVTEFLTLNGLSNVSK